MLIFVHGINAHADEGLPAPSMKLGEVIAKVGIRDD